MPLGLTCRLATFSPGGALPAAVWQGLAASVRQQYEIACGGRLSMNTVVVPDEGGLPSSSQWTTATDLHEFARILNGNHEYWGDPRPTGPPVGNVAVIYADYYAPYPPALGVMFDRGFSTADDGNTSVVYTGVPREACAVFVGCIRQLHSGNESNVHQEAWFTTIHEMGHVFNLQHTPFELTFLSSSPSDAPYPVDAVGFSEQQVALLSQCDSSPYVWPGGSDFRDRGPYGNLDCERVSIDGTLPFGLELRIDSCNREFYRFEPVELDVELRVAPGVRRRFYVPDRVDPGYPDFRIWIEEPSGARRLYRSPRHYCSSRSRVGVSPTKTFRRDISVFGEAGGYTFRVPGVHRVWTEFDVSRRGTLRSNTLELDVLAYRPGNAAFERLHSLVAEPAIARVLYHRVDPSDGDVLNKVSEALENDSKLRGRGAIRYAMGRAWLQQLLRRPSAPSEPVIEAGRKQLERAAADDGLGEHRSLKVERMLRRLRRQDLPRVDLVWGR